MRISAEGKTVDQVVRIASASSTKNARLVIINCSHLTVDQLVRIGSAGKGCVFFELEN